MIRSAAKNADAIAVVVDPADYQLIASELDSGNGCLEADLHHRLMRKAFNHTADYDSAIATALDERAGEKSLRPAFCDGRTLRYGENVSPQ